MLEKNLPIIHPINKKNVGDRSEEVALTMTENAENQQHKQQNIVNNETHNNEKPTKKQAENHSKREDLPWYAHTPISLFAAVMGINGLAVVWKKVNAQLESDIPEEIYWALGIIGAVHFGIFTLLYLLKMFKYTDLVIKEFNHPIKVLFLLFFNFFNVL